MTHKISRKFKLTQEEFVGINNNALFKTITQPARVTSYLLFTLGNLSYTVEILKGVGTYLRIKTFQRADESLNVMDRRILLKQQFLRDAAQWLIKKSNATRLVVYKKIVIIPKEKHILFGLEEVPAEMGDFAGYYFTVIRNCQKKENASLEKLIQTSQNLGMQNKIPLNISFMALRKASAKGQATNFEEFEDKVKVEPGPKKDISAPAKVNNLNDLSAFFEQTKTKDIRVEDEEGEPPLETA